jgi:tetratricopeptide (TPR) repeat protein
LAARIDRLSLDDKRVLQVAAAIGKDVPFALLHAVAELPEGMLRGALERLQAAEFVYQTALSPDLEYAFKHALTQDVAYSGMLQERRSELHTQIVGAIETLYRYRLDEHIERLAYHSLQGELREKAVNYLHQAGLRAGARSARQESVAWYDSALSVLDSLPPSASVLEQGFDLRLEIRHMLVQLGDFHGALERLREAEGLAVKLNDDHRKGQSCVFQMSMHATVGEMDDALKLGARAQEIVSRLGDLRLRILTTTYLEQAHCFRGDYQRVVELATANLASLPADSIYDHFGTAMPVSIFDRAWLFMSLAELGRFAKANELAAEAMQLAKPTRRIYTDAWLHQNAAITYLRQGDWQKAHLLIEHSISVYRTGNFGLFLPIAVACSAWALAQLGKASEAINRLRESEELVERIEVRDTVTHFGRVYLSMGRACLLLGQLDEAKRLGSRVAEAFSSRFGYSADASHLLGDIATHTDRFDAKTGEAHYRQALALAEPRGMRPLIAHCHLGLGRLRQRTGNREQAREHLATATSMYREMDMRFYLEQAEAEKISRSRGHGL